MLEALDEEVTQLHARLQAVDPATRRVLPVLERNNRRDNTIELFNLLMGKGEASGRRAWMEANGHTVEADV